MKRIGLLSDTHGFLDDAVFGHFESCDEIWHAGDFGSLEIAERLSRFRPLRAVFGNIDGADIRSRFPKSLRWTCEQAEVLMTHIGGYPPKYNAEWKTELLALRPQLFICGHSHILKIIYDEKIDCLHLNPGAAGREGWHKIRTVVRFCIEEKRFSQCEVIELGKRG
jgi:uncharacterized protein